MILQVPTFSSPSPSPCHQASHEDPNDQAEDRQSPDDTLILIDLAVEHPVINGNP